jgi:IPT/TIG domain
VAPTIASFTPTSGPAGTPVSVTISGSGLGGAKKVMIGGRKAAVSSDTATAIVATVSTKATSGAVSVTTRYGTSVAATSYTAS